MARAVNGNVYWTNDIATKLPDYNVEHANTFFKAENDIWLTSSNLIEICPGKSVPEMIWAEISEEQGYKFMEELLNKYDDAVIKYGPIMPKKVAPNDIVVFDIFTDLLGNSTNYIKGAQNKWNEEKANKPEVYMLIGERTV